MEIGVDQELAEYRLMAKGKIVDYILLDVGCGTRPKGDVNIDFFRSGLNPQTGDQIQGEFMSPQRIKNFVVADGMYLPFKDESFSTVFSSHTIEHVHHPLLMLRDMCRVAKRKVIVRCPHRRGIGAVMLYHLNYFDEEWFKTASDILGFKSNRFITSYDYPSSRLKKICPKKLQKTLIWRVLQRFEGSKFMKKSKTPSEMEVWVRKRHNLADSAELRFVVVYDNPEIFENCFASNSYIPPNSVIAYHNIHNEPIPKFFNKAVQRHLKENIWFVFCHQDFILREDLRSCLKGKEVGAIYGPIGAHLVESEPFGMIIQADGTRIGRKIEKDTPVQALDEMCLIVHSEVFSQGLSFDESFRFYFYGADFCMQAYTLGFDVLAMQLKCQHKRKTPYGDITSECLSSLNLFKEKWKQFLPIKTTTRLITDGK